MNIDSLGKWHFGMSEDLANELLTLVLSGKKTATSSSLRAYEAEGEPIPRAGERSVITYFDGTPACVIENVSVNVIPFADIDFDLARLEGEDESLTSWREKHESFFKAEGDEVGYSFDKNMPVVFEVFKLIELL